MKKETMELIGKVLMSDESVSPEMRDYIIKAAQKSVPKRKLLTAKEAQEVLGISRVTLREYARRGVLSQINISRRKVRFDEQEVYRLAYSGLDGIEDKNRQDFPPVVENMTMTKIGTSRINADAQK